MLVRNGATYYGERVKDNLRRHTLIHFLLFSWIDFSSLRA
jgi:hypothetical protein